MIIRTLPWPSSHDRPWRRVGCRRPGTARGGDEDTLVAFLCGTRAARRKVPPTAGGAPDRDGPGRGFPRVPSSGRVGSRRVRKAHAQDGGLSSNRANGPDPPSPRRRDRASPSLGSRVHRPGRTGRQGTAMPVRMDRRRFGPCRRGRPVPHPPVAAGPRRQRSRRARSRARRRTGLRRGPAPRPARSGFP